MGDAGKMRQQDEDETATVAAMHPDELYKVRYVTLLSASATGLLLSMHIMGMLVDNPSMHTLQHKVTIMRLHW